MMLNLSYESWYKASTMIQAMGTKVQKMYLQMYTFSLLGGHWEEISSRNFFDRYIKNGQFLELDSTYKKAIRYIQKGDGSLRRTSLISPLNYLILLSIGCEVEKYYKHKRKTDDKHASVYCSSSFGLEATEQYKKSYNEYRTSIQYGHDSYSYYFKIDIKNFYDFIDVDKLFNLIEEEKIFDTRSILLLSTFIKLIGDGRFPTVDGHGGLSYLATNVYLDTLDFSTQKWIEDRLESKDYYLVRYVDDLYIFFNSDTDERAELFATDLLDYVRDLYIGFNLYLNESKQVRLGKTSEVSEEVSVRFYDFFINGEHLNYELYYSTKDLLEFFKRINEMPKHASSDNFSYALDAFKKKDLEISRSDILNGFLYNNSKIFENDEIVRQLDSIILRNIRFLKLSVKQLVVAILNTKNRELIKKMLNQIFENYREGRQTKYDELIIVEYLIQRGLKHKELISKLNESNVEVGEYIETFCSSKSMTELLSDERNNKIVFDTNGNSKIYDEDTILHFMMLMFSFYRQQNNIMVAHSFLKSYFDRYVAIVSLFKGEVGKKNGMPDYKKYYKVQEQKNFLKRCNLDKYQKIVENLHNSRNKNPLNHSSAEMLNQNQIYAAEYKKNISDVIMLIQKYREHIVAR